MLQTALEDLKALLAASGKVSATDHAALNRLSVLVASQRLAAHQSAAGSDGGSGATGGSGHGSGGSSNTDSSGREEHPASFLAAARSGRGSGMPERLTVVVHGDVQGVGFRWWTRSRALELSLVGTATNLPDGRVQIVAEGLPVKMSTSSAVSAPLTARSDPASA